MDLTRYADAYWAAKDDRVDRDRLRLIVERVPETGEVLVIDGGPGMLAEMIRARNPRVRMTDVSAHAVERARRKGLDAAQADTDDDVLPFPDGSFDCVVSDSAIEHRCFPERAVGEAARLLREGGLFLLLVPNIAHWRQRLWLLLGRFPVITDGPTDPSHLRHFAAPELRELVRAQGFVVERTLGFPSLWVKGLYPRLLRAPGVRALYGFLTRLRPTLFGRDILLVCRRRAAAGR